MNEVDTTNTQANDALEAVIIRRPYEAPRVTKKRSVARVTLFSGGGATAGGLTAAG